MLMKEYEKKEITEQKMSTFGSFRPLRYFPLNSLHVRSGRDLE
jgi:hypothetical protein